MNYLLNTFLFILVFLSHLIFVNELFADEDEIKRIVDYVIATSVERNTVQREQIPKPDSQMYQTFAEEIPLRGYFAGESLLVPIFYSEKNHSPFVIFLRGASWYRDKVTIFKSQKELENSHFGVASLNRPENLVVLTNENLRKTHGPKVSVDDKYIQLLILIRHSNKRVDKQDFLDESKQDAELFLAQSKTSLERFLNFAKVPESEFNEIIVADYGKNPIRSNGQMGYYANPFGSFVFIDGFAYRTWKITLPRRIEKDSLCKLSLLLHSAAAEIE